MYATREDVERIYGKSNVEKWADVNNDKNAQDVAQRVVWALEMAHDELEARLRYGPYALPFQPVPKTITRMEATLAGVILYDSRLITDEEDSPSPMKKHEKWVARMIADIFSRRLRLDAPYQSIDYPKVIEDDTSDLHLEDPFWIDP